jgi:hypothetical protein
MYDVPSPVSRLVGGVFAASVLAPLRLASRVLSEQQIWPVLEWLGKRVAAAAAHLTRPALDGGPHRLQNAMDFVHLAESLVGIEGEWEIVDQSTAVRRVHRCPHARRLSRTTGFCTRLGAALGQGLSEALVDDRDAVRFEVRSTLSQGHACCEYRLTLKHQDTSRPQG